MFSISKIFFTLLLFIVCSCSSDSSKVDEDLFLGSGDGSSPSLEFFSVTPLKGGTIEYETFEHFFDIALQRDAKTESCGVSSSSVTNEKKTCLVEINELDIFFHGLELEINTPPKMCTYLALDNYWYYNYEVGKGATSVAITQNVDLSGVSTWTCTSSGADCSDNSELNFDVGTGIVSCVYDYTSFNAPNCCLGKYNLNTRLITQVAGDPTATPPIPPSQTVDSESSTVEWGGDLVQCSSGPGMSSEWELTEVDGLLLPKRALYDVRAGGIKTKIKILEPIKQSSLGNVFAANFYSGLLDPSAPSIQHPHFHEATIGGRLVQTKLPQAVAPLVDRSGDVLPLANDAYRALCLDEDYEILQQINVYIREWNTLDKYTQYVTDITDITPFPDIIGNEDGTSCGYFTSGSECNDKRDWDDLVGTYPHK